MGPKNKHRELKIKKKKKGFLASSTLLHAYLNVLCQGVEDLLGHCQRSGEVPLACFIHDILPRVIPVEITDGLLMEEDKTVQCSR